MKINVREGVRRLSIVLGILGAILGTLAAFPSARDLWDARMASKRFESLTALPEVQRDRKELMEAVQKEWLARNTPPEERKKMATLEESGHSVDGVERLKVDLSTGNIVSVELLTGEKVQRTQAPQPKAYVFLLLYPISGFLVPWGGVRVLTWIGSGFFQPRG